MTDVFNVKKCPLCGSTNLIYNRDTGEIICRDCGYVIKTMNIDPGPEWNNYPSSERDNIRTGPPLTPLIADRGMTTALGKIQDEVEMPWKKMNDIERIRRWIHISSANRDGKLRRALNTLILYGEKLNTPTHVLERAAEIYRMIMEKNLNNGRSIKLVAAVSLYIALREFEIAYPIKSIAKKFNIKIRRFNKYYNFLLRNTNIKVPSTNPSLYVRRIVSKAGLPQDTVVYAEKIISLIREKKVTAGKDPVGLASAAVYYAALLNDYRITYQKIAKASDRTEVTVRNRHRWLMKTLGFKDLNGLKRLIDEYQTPILTI